MQSVDPGRYTIKYATYGFLFGCIFPIVATCQDLISHNFDFTFTNILVVQRTQSLHWIIDTAPLILGILASVVGRKQVVIIRSLAIMRKALDAVQLANRMKSEFVANVSHEIRTPMNGIVGAVQLLSEQSDDIDQEEAFSILRNASDQLTRVVDDILEISKIDANQATLNSDVFSIRDIVDSCVSVSKVQADNKGVEFILQLEEDIPESIVGDSGRLIQILNNLLSNAVKFTHRGFIRLEVRCVVKTENDISLLFSVEDTGIGIAREKLDQIFIPFAQADGTITRRYGGTGLGLAIALRWANVMKGSLQVESEDGSGSKFELVLPFQYWDDRPLDELDDKTNEAANLPQDTYSKRFGDTLNIVKPGRRTVLFVDDETKVLSSVRRLLRKQNWNLLFANSGMQGLEIIEDHDVDLVVSDIRMPHMDGLEFLNKVKARFPNIGRIAFTGYADDEMLSRIFSEADVYTLIPKPWDNNEMKLIISDAFSKLT
ncbi:MAG: response regulator [Gemmatimonadetes bacterium]|jgi:signal transduction histidine kinase|nr:response regulator [Gemmatimonadota bacterium]MBT5329382.1 response regulator [Gemmatimonadota bacterium]MBT6618285.1 response regulator [Gemmatimonadota bacterium]